MNVILGYAGGIGYAAAKALLNRGEQVTGIVRNIDKAKRYSEYTPGIELVRGDASSPDDLNKILGKGAKTLFYCVNVPYPDWEKKVRQLLKVSIDACIKNNVKLIFPGNVYIYGHAQYNPVDEKHPYAAHTKKGKIRIEMEEMLKEASEKQGLVYTIVRFPDFYGPFVINGFSEKIYQNALAGKKLMWVGGRNVSTEYIFIEDAGEAIVIAALSDKGNNKIFNVPGYSETTSQKYLEEISKQGGKGSGITFLNSSLVFNIMGIFSKLIYELKEMLYLKRTKLILDGSLFKNTFGTLPSRPYEQGIAETMAWVKGFFK
jgi:nucleoside-diphosphate-sugar epimerase